MQTVNLTQIRTVLSSGQQLSKLNALDTSMIISLHPQTTQRGRCLYDPHFKDKEPEQTRLGHLPKVTSHWDFQSTATEFKPVGNDLEAALGNGKATVLDKHSFYSGGLLQRSSRLFLQPLGVQRRAQFELRGKEEAGIFSEE